MGGKKHKLEMAIEEDFCLLGVVSDEPDYRICWLINQAMGMNFEKQDDLLLYHKKLQEEQSFSLFSNHVDEAMITFRIIQNRADNGYYLDPLKKLDYLVHIQGEINTIRINAFMQAMVALEQVRMCVPVDLSRLKDKERLLLW
jgi:hypothetical protein